MSKIEWTERTWNPIVGCSVVSPGCTNCYAMRMAARLGRMGQDRYAGLTKASKAGPVWTGEMRLVEAALALPLRRAKPTTWFVNSMSDLFHENVPDAWIDRVFAVMALAPQHTFQVLTKRAARMRAYMLATDAIGPIRPLRVEQAARAITGGTLPDGTFPGWPSGFLPLTNVWLGVSAEDQSRANERVPDLLATPAAVRFVSAEPLLGPIDFRNLARGQDPRDLRSWWYDAFAGRHWSDAGDGGPIGRLDWIIVGGESGPGARPMHPAWVRSIRDQCDAANVVFHFKQWGSWSVAMDRDTNDADWRADYSHKLNDRRPDISWLNVDGGRGFHGEQFHVMRRVSKAAAGRLLDGRTHDGMPRQIG